MNEIGTGSLPLQPVTYVGREALRESWAKRSVLQSEERVARWYLGRK